MNAVPVHDSLTSAGEDSNKAGLTWVEGRKESTKVNQMVVHFIAQHGWLVANELVPFRRHALPFLFRTTRTIRSSNPTNGSTGQLKKTNQVTVKQRFDFEIASTLNPPSSKRQGATVFRYTLSPHVARYEYKCDLCQLTGWVGVYSQSANTTRRFVAQITPHIHLQTSRMAAPLPGKLQESWKQTAIIW